MRNLSLFDLRPVSLAREPEPAPVKESLTTRADIARRIHHKAGTFTEQPSGREFSIVQLIDGRYFAEFTNGERKPLPLWLSPIYIGDALKNGNFREVAHVG